MLQSEFDATRAELEHECVGIMAKKRPDYAYTSADVLNNFKRTADRTGTTPGVVWAVFFAKHVDAIIKAMTQGGENSEPLMMRFADARNYIDLGFAIWTEHQGGLQSSEKEQATTVLDETIDKMRKRYCTVCERDRMASVPRTTFVTGMSEVRDSNARGRAAPRIIPGE